jgi:DNA-binding MarR family transcriptional regulator
MEPNGDVVRRFNRYYTERIGILSDRYLDQSRPLAEARLLFEIGSQARPVRELRLGLDLDSGYLARLLRSLEHQGLATLVADPDDRRVRIAMLTAAGTNELQELNARADAAVDELLAHLSDPDRVRILDAMADILRLLRRSEITIQEADPGSSEAQRCLLAYAGELDHRFPEGFPPSDLVSAEEIRAGGACLIARDRRRAVGCGILRHVAGGAFEIRHLWVSPDARGLGVARLLLAQLERVAAERGSPTIQLDTHRILTEAIALYQTSGYQEISPYDANPHAHLWFEKQLDPKLEARP